MKGPEDHPQEGSRSTHTTGATGTSSKRKRNESESSVSHQKKQKAAGVQNSSGGWARAPALVANRTPAQGARTSVQSPSVPTQSPSPPRPPPRQKRLLAEALAEARGVSFTNSTPPSRATDIGHILGKGTTGSGASKETEGQTLDDELIDELEEDVEPRDRARDTDEEHEDLLDVIDADIERQRSRASRNHDAEKRPNNAQDDTEFLDEWLGEGGHNNNTGRDILTSDSSDEDIDSPGADDALADLL